MYFQAMGKMIRQIVTISVVFYISYLLWRLFCGEWIVITANMFITDEVASHSTLWGVIWHWHFGEILKPISQTPTVREFGLYLLDTPMITVVAAMIFISMTGLTLKLAYELTTIIDEMVKERKLYLEKSTMDDQARALERYKTLMGN